MHFRTDLNRCPEYHAKLIPYKTRRRSVKSVEYGKFPPESINKIVSPHCTYANDLMVYSAMQMYIEGRSSSEISRKSGTGISEGHVRKLNIYLPRTFSKRGLISLCNEMCLASVSIMQISWSSERCALHPFTSPFFFASVQIG